MPDAESTARCAPGLRLRWGDLRNHHAHGFDTLDSFGISFNRPHTDASRNRRHTRISRTRRHAARRSPAPIPGRKGRTRCAEPGPPVPASPRSDPRCAQPPVGRAAGTPRRPAVPTERGNDERRSAGTQDRRPPECPNGHKTRGPTARTGRRGTRIARPVAHPPHRAAAQPGEQRPNGNRTPHEPGADPARMRESGPRGDTDVMGTGFRPPRSHVKL